jgi:hypothetical protein
MGKNSRMRIRVQNRLVLGRFYELHRFFAKKSDTFLTKYYNHILLLIFSILDVFSWSVLLIKVK